MGYLDSNQSLSLIAAGIVKFAYQNYCDLDMVPFAHSLADGNDKLGAFLNPDNPIVVPPTFPSHGNQVARLLAWLLTGRSIDPLTAWRELGMYRLSDAVYRLNGRGWKVITGEKHVVNRFGEQCDVADYYLPADIILLAGVQGYQYMMAEGDIWYPCAVKKENL